VKSVVQILLATAGISPNALSGGIGSHFDLHSGSGGLFGFAEQAAGFDGRFIRR